jgi:hypothetical protein
MAKHCREKRRRRRGGPEPSDGKLVIAVYIKGSGQSQPAREKVIARLAQAA